jgi:hypothetical protein
MGHYNHEGEHCESRPGQAVLPEAGMKKSSYNNKQKK